MTTELARFVPTNAVQVTQYLQASRDWLREQQTIDVVAEFKDRNAAIREYMHQRDLGREAIDAATEVVLRSERRIAELVIEAQEAGTLPKQSTGGLVKGTTLKVRDLYPSHDGRTAALIMAKADDDTFTEAVEAAKASEHGLSRAAVVRELAPESNAAQRTTQRRGDAPPVARSDWHRKKRRIDPNRVVREMVYALDGIVQALAVVTPEDVNDAAREEWAQALKRSLQALELFRKGLAK